MFVLAKRRLKQLFMVPWRARWTVAFEADRNVGNLVCPASPRPNFRCALRRLDPPVVCPGFGFGLDRYFNYLDYYFEIPVNEFYEFYVKRHSKESKKHRLNDPLKHEQAKSYLNRWRNKTHGSSPVHPRFISGLSAGRKALFLPGCRPVERRFFCLCKNHLM